MRLPLLHPGMAQERWGWGSAVGMDVQAHTQGCHSLCRGGRVGGGCGGIPPVPPACIEGRACSRCGLTQPTRGWASCSCPLPVTCLPLITGAGERVIGSALPPSHCRLTIPVTSGVTPSSPTPVCTPPGPSSCKGG